MMAKLLLSVDRRHDVEVAAKVVRLALENRDLVVGIDVCGDPTKGDVGEFVPAFRRARGGGLKVTVHLGEVSHRHQLIGREADLLLKARVATRFAGGGPPSHARQIGPCHFLIQSHDGTYHITQDSRRNLCEGLTCSPYYAPHLTHRIPRSPRISCARPYPQ